MGGLELQPDGTWDMWQRSLVPPEKFTGPIQPRTWAYHYGLNFPEVPEGTSISEVVKGLKEQLGANPL